MALTVNKDVNDFIKGLSSGGNETKPTSSKASEISSKASDVSTAALLVSKFVTNNGDSFLNEFTTDTLLSISNKGLLGSLKDLVNGAVTSLNGNLELQSMLDKLNEFLCPEADLADDPAIIDLVNDVALRLIDCDLDVKKITNNLIGKTLIYNEVDPMISNTVVRTMSKRKFDLHTVVAVNKPFIKNDLTESLRRDPNRINNIFIDKETLNCHDKETDVLFMKDVVNDDVAVMNDDSMMNLCKQSALDTPLNDSGTLSYSQEMSLFDGF